MMTTREAFTVKCIHCGAECAELRGNLGWTSEDSIQVTVSGTTFHACTACSVAFLPPHIKRWLEKALAEKRAIGGPPCLFLNAAALGS